MIKRILGKLAEMLRAWIPRHVRASVVLAVYEGLRKHTNRISEEKTRQNAAAARDVLREGRDGSFLGQGGFIEDQAQWGRIPFGSGKRSDMAFSGCGIIAVYNALTALGEMASADTMVGLIGDFERDGAAWNGDLGCSPGAICDHIRRRGFAASLAAGDDPDSIEKIEESCDVFIITAYNDRTDLTAGMHTVCMTKDDTMKRGGYVIHNGYKRGPDGSWAAFRTGEGRLVDAAAHIGAKPAMISVIGICKKC